MNLPTLSAIITAHADTPWGIIRNLDMQSVHPSQLLVGVSDWWPVHPDSASMVVRRDGKPDVVFQRFENMDDFGYSKRNALLAKATGDYVGFFNHDDSYNIKYVEIMLSAAKEHDADVVFCMWIDGKLPQYTFGTEFMSTNSTLGNFIVRRQVLADIGGFPIEGLGSQVMSQNPVAFNPNVTNKLRKIYEQQLKYTEEAVSDPHNNASVIKRLLDHKAVGYIDGVAIDILSEVSRVTVMVTDVMYYHNVPYWSTIRPSYWGSTTEEPLFQNASDPDS